VNEKRGLEKTVEQCQRKVKHLKGLYRERKDWNRRQSGGNIRKSPHYDLLDSILGCREGMNFSNVEQTGLTDSNCSTPTERSPTPLSTSGSSSSSKETSDTPTTSQGRASRSERKKRAKSNKRRSAGVESDDKEGMSAVIKRLATEEDQMGKVMERMQAAQEQQMQLMTQLLGSFNQHMEKKCGQ